MILVLIPGVLQATLPTAIIALTPVLCRYIASFNNGGKKETVAEFTCWFHLSNIMLDSVLNASMG